MGDVLGITEADGNFIAQYLYDEWGKLLSIDTADEDGSTAYREIAEANPLRYRGYYYDNETGYYYLNSRYYDPVICRFINADSYGYIDNTERFGYNLYSYCWNNPINFSDPSGHEAEEDTRIKAILQVLLGSIVLDDVYKTFLSMNIDLAKIMNKAIEMGVENLFREFVLFCGAFDTALSNELDNYFSSDIIVDIFSNTLEGLIHFVKETAEASKGKSFITVVSLISSLISFSESMDNAGKKVLSKTTDVILTISNLAIDVGTLFIKIPVLDSITGILGKILTQTIAMRMEGIIIC